MDDVRSVADGVGHDAGFGPDGCSVPETDLAPLPDPRMYHGVADMSAQCIAAIKRDVESLQGSAQVPSFPYFMAHICRCVK